MPPLTVHSPIPWVYFWWLLSSLVSQARVGPDLYNNKDLLSDGPRTPGDKGTIIFFWGYNHLYHVFLRITLYLATCGNCWLGSVQLSCLLPLLITTLAVIAGFPWDKLLSNTSCLCIQILKAKLKYLFIPCVFTFSLRITSQETFICCYSLWCCMVCNLCHIASNNYRHNRHLPCWNMYLLRTDLSGYSRYIGTKPLEEDK